MASADELRKARSALSSALADLDRRVVDSIRSVPGSGAAQIAERLGEPVVDVRRSLYRLKRAGRVRVTGNTRAATYKVAARRARR